MKACKNCGRPVERPGPAYCSEPCWEAAAARRRPPAAARARARRATIAQEANTTINTEGTWIVTRHWRDGQIIHEHREPAS